MRKRGTCKACPNPTAYYPYGRARDYCTECSPYIQKDSVGRPSADKERYGLIDSKAIQPDFEHDNISAPDATGRLYRESALPNSASSMVTLAEEL